MSEPLFTIEQVITMLYDLEDTYGIFVDISLAGWGDPVLASLSKEQVIELLETGRVIL